jgi:hypothetical protein
MNKFYEKARAVVRLLENYCLRIARAFKVVGAVFNFLQAESYEMQELCEQLMLQAMAEWEVVEKAIKQAKEEIMAKDVKEEE